MNTSLPDFHNEKRFFKLEIIQVKYKMKSPFTATVGAFSSFGI